MKRCSRCHEIKESTEFCKDARSKDYLCSECRSCRQKTAQKYRREHPEKIKESNRKWYLKDPSKRKEVNRKWAQSHAEQRRKTSRRWDALHPDKVLLTQRKVNAKIRSTIKGRLKFVMGTAICNALRGRKHGRKWETLVNYTTEQLKAHLEKQFLPGMSWENYGQWHIDHIIPVAAHNFRTPEDLDFERCWALENLRPLWAKENIRKRDKLERPFQPSLTI